MPISNFQVGSFSFDPFNPFGSSSDQRGGRVVGESGRPLHVRDSHSSHKRYSLAQQTWSHVPRPKFLFWVRFFGNFYARKSGEEVSGTDRSYIRGISFLVKSIDKPTVTPEVQTLHQYNKKRIIHTGSKYMPITMKFHDDVNDDILSFWQDYYEWYFASSRGKSVSDFSYDVTNRSMTAYGPTGAWGFAPSQGLDAGNSSYWLSHIEIYTFFGGKMTQFDLINPRITSFDHDANDYAIGTEGSEVTMQLEYEGIIYRGGTGTVNNLGREQLQDLLLDLGDYYQLPEILNNTDLFSTVPKRILQDATTAIMRGQIPQARGILTGILGETIPLRRDQQGDILQGAYGAVVSNVLNRQPLFSSFGGSQTAGEIAGYRANRAGYGQRTTGAQQQLAGRGLLDGLGLGAVGDFANSAVEGVQNAVSSISSGLASAGRAVIDTGSEVAESVFGDAFAVTASENGKPVSAYAWRDPDGTGLTTEGAQALNALSPPDKTYVMAEQQLASAAAQANNPSDPLNQGTNAYLADVRARLQASSPRLSPEQVALREAAARVPSNFLADRNA